MQYKYAHYFFKLIRKVNFKASYWWRLNGKSLKAQMLTGFDHFARRFVNWVPSGRRIGTGLFNVAIGIFESRLIAEINCCQYIIHLHHLYNLGLKFFAAIQCKHRMFAICFCYTLFFQFGALIYKHFWLLDSYTFETGSSQ